MKPFGMLVGLLLASPVVLAPAPAGAQPAPGLTYVQPLAPGAAMRVQERLRQLGAYSGGRTACGARTAKPRWSASSRGAGCR
jgi:hypothetical protein